MIASPKGRRMLKSVSPIYGQSKTMQAVFEAVGAEFDDLDQLSDEVLAQLFPQTATWGIVYWEALLKLKSNKDFPIEQRRARVLSKMQQRWPVTPARMEIYISSVSGGIPVMIVQNVEDYTFRVDFMYMPHEGKLLNLAEVARTIESTKPAHLAYQLCVAFYAESEVAEEYRAWLFNYPLCNVFKAGTYPETVILGKVLDCSAIVSSIIKTTVFDFILTGTEPFVSTLGTTLKTGCGIETNILPYRFEYDLCGTGPAPGTKGHIENINMNLANELTAACFLYPPTGELLCGTYPAA